MLENLNELEKIGLAFVTGLVAVPAFCTVIVENEEKTGMKFIIKEEK